MENFRSQRKKYRERVLEAVREGMEEKADEIRVRAAVRFSRIAEESNNSYINRAVIKWCESQLSKVDIKNIKLDEQRTADSESPQSHSEENVEDGTNWEEFVKHPDEIRTGDDLVGESIQGNVRRSVNWIDCVLDDPDYKAFDNSTIANLLFYGPPGTGKTHSAEAVASELCDMGFDVTFMNLGGEEFKDKLYGESSSLVRSALEWANGRDSDLSVVFIDEFDDLARSRDESHEATASITNTLQRLTEGANPMENVALIAATNKKEILDEAIDSRFVPIEFEEPSPETKKEILWINLDGRPRFSKSALDGIESSLEGLNGRDLKNIAARAKVISHARGEEDISPRYLQEAIEEEIKDSYRTSD